MNVIKIIKYGVQSHYVGRFRVRMALGKKLNKDFVILNSTWLFGAQNDECSDTIGSCSHL